MENPFDRKSLIIIYMYRSKSVWEWGNNNVTKGTYYTKNRMVISDLRND